MTVVTKNLGAVKGIHRGSSSPTNTSMLWYDTGSNSVKYYDTGSATWKVVAATSLNVPSGSTFIAVSKSGDDGTGSEDDLSTPFLTISAAYTQAKTLIPSSSNPIFIYIFGGEYSESISIDGSYIYLISATGQGSELDQFSSLGASGSVHIDGTLTVSVTGQKFMGLNIDEVSLTNPSLDIFMYNCGVTTFSATSAATTISGTYYGCNFGTLLNVADGQVIDGSFYNCLIDGLVGNHVLSGYFNNCTFGDDSVQKTSGSGVLGGQYYNCTFGDDCIKYSSGVTGMGASLDNPIKFRNCIFGTTCLVGVGGLSIVSMKNCDLSNTSFVDTTGELNGKIYSCDFDQGNISYTTIGDIDIYDCSFKGVDNILADTYEASCVIDRCKFEDDDCLLVNTGGTHAGVIRNSDFQNNSVNAQTSGNAVTLSGNYYRCRGANDVFGSGAGASVSGEFYDCHVGETSFGSGGTITSSSVFDQCTHGGTDGFAGGTDVLGRVYRLRMRVNQAAAALSLGDGGGAYFCDIKNDGGDSIDNNSGGSTASVAHCVLSPDVGANVSNNIGTPYNVDDSDMA